VIEVLLDNVYSTDLVFDKIDTRIKEHIQRTTLIKKPEIGTEKDRKMLVFPYIKNVSETIKSAIDKKEYMIGYRILNKLTNFIKRHKDQNKYENNNNIVYKILCNNCDVSYVGQTKRYLKTQIKEHVKNIKAEESKLSVVSKHMLECNHIFDWKNVRILDFEQNYHKRIISKMIHIKTKNGINSVDDIECLDSSYFNLFTKIFDKKFRLR